LTKYKKKKGEAQMKAVVYEEYAPDDDFKRILQVKDVEDPKPKPNTGPLAAHFRL
jgi:hypothetical protein